MTSSITIRRVLVCRVVWVFGQEVQGPITEVTPTRLTQGVLATLRVADERATSVLSKRGKLACVPDVGL